MLAPQLYYPVFIHIILFMTLVRYNQISGYNYMRILYGKQEDKYTFIITTILILFMGLRPLSYVFVDTMNYAQTYSLYQQGHYTFNAESKEIVFECLMSQCSKIMDVSYFFLIIEIGYVGLMFWTCKRLCNRNVFICFLFCIGSFSFFSYGVNGIRNGLACSFVMLSLSYMNESFKNKIKALILALIAFNIHRSTALPILAVLISYYYRNTKIYIYIWFFSALISLLIGDYVESVFVGLGFDDRMDSYILSDNLNDQFSSIGFRWDFLLYSMMPIILGWYCVIKKNIFDNNYLLLLNSYIIANSFWIMVIRASFSNRFAYLSWFLYPLVLAYPLLKLSIWSKQGKITGLILLGHTGFTYLMWLIK